MIRGNFHDVRTSPTGRIAPSRQIPATAGLVRLSQRGDAPRQIALFAGRGASPNGGKPRCGGVQAGIVVGGEQRSTGTCPVVACSPRKHLWRQALAYPRGALSPRHSGLAPLWRRSTGIVAGGEQRTTGLTGLPPLWRRSTGIVAGGEQRTTGTCPVVACPQGRQPRPVGLGAAYLIYSVSCCRSSGGAWRSAAPRWVKKSSSDMVSSVCSMLEATSLTWLVM